MQKRPNNWKKSVEQIKNAKIKWTQFSTDKRSVIQQFRILSFEELQEKYSNLSDFFWRDNGKCLFTLFICLKSMHLKLIDKAIYFSTRNFGPWQSAIKDKTSL